MKKDTLTSASISYFKTFVLFIYFFLTKINTTGTLIVIFLPFQKKCLKNKLKVMFVVQNGSGKVSGKIIS